MAKTLRNINTLYVLDSDEYFCRHWDILTAVLLVFVATVTPFELGFLKTDFDDPASLCLFVVNRIVVRAEEEVQVEHIRLTTSG